MNAPVNDRTVEVSIQRRLLWEMRNRYDAATVDDILRVIYCASREMAYGTVCGTVILSYVILIILAVNIPGPVISQWPTLVPLGILSLAAYRRAYRKMTPYSRAREAIVNADPEKFKRIADELEPLEKEYRRAQRETATVSLRL